MVNNRYVSSDRHGEFNIKLQCLIEEQNKQNNQYRFFQNAELTGQNLIVDIVFSQFGFCFNTQCSMGYGTQSFF